MLALVKLRTEQNGSAGKRTREIRQAGAGVGKSDAQSTPTAGGDAGHQSCLGRRIAAKQARCRCGQAYADPLADGAQAGVGEWPHVPHGAHHFREEREELCELLLARHQACIAPAAVKQREESDLAAAMLEFGGNSTCENGAE